jgi:hypothetical protein
MPQVQLYTGPRADHLNNVFGDCLVKYIDALGRKGCCRTALEYCKLLLGLGPQNDTHGVLLRIDYYAIRAKEYDYILKLVDNFANQFYKYSDKISSIRLMPNFMMTSALAIKSLP